MDVDTQTEILKLLVNPMRVKDLAFKMNLHISGAYYHINNLRLRGLIVREPGDRKRWCLPTDESKVTHFKQEAAWPSQAVRAMRFPNGSANLSEILQALSGFVAQWDGPSEDPLIVEAVISKCHLENAVQIVQKRHPVKIEGI